MFFCHARKFDDADLTKTGLPLRGEAHSVMQAINRQVAHYSYHVGQIAFLARHYAGACTGNRHHPEKEITAIQRRQ